MERAVRKAAAPESPPKPKTIVFFHPDLGIGGAERLVVDAAVGLQDRGHKVVIYTSHRDTNHCFDETKDGTLEVRVRGDWLFPATLFGRFKILFSILRQLHLLCDIRWSGELAQIKPTVFFIDQLSAGIPFLRWYFEDNKIIFYCHFPDLLLVQGRQRWYKRIWRIGFDWIEGWGMRGADRVVVNSGFTKGVVEDIWKGLGGERGVGIVYPCVDTTQPAAEDRPKDVWHGKRILLSINRFERKKRVDLAIQAFAGLKAADRKGVRLVLAGGYDTRVAENVSCHKELEELAASLKLKAATAKNVISAQAVPSDIEVLFLLSVPAQLKSTLLKTATLLIYTPPDEHFGIVPLEAMLVGLPVLASSSGGPLETVIEGETGWLRSVDNTKEWTAIMHLTLYEMPPAQLKLMAEASRKRVQGEFSKSKMALRLDEEIDAMIKAPRQRATETGDVITGAALFFGAFIALCLVINEAFKIGISNLLDRPEETATGVGILVLALLVMVLVIWRLRWNESAFT